MSAKAKNAAFIAGMILSWSAYYAISKRIVDETGSAYEAGFLLRSTALVFLTIQMFADNSWRKIFHQGRVIILLCIGILGFLLDLFANLGYAGGALSTGTALLKTDVLMVNIITVTVMHKRLYLTDWVGSLVMLAGVLLVLGFDIEGVTLNPTDLFFLLSAACVTLNAFLIKHLQDRYETDSDVISYYNNFVVLLLFSFSTIHRGDLSLLRNVSSSSFWILVVLGGLAQTGIYFFYYRNLKRHEVWIVKLWLLLMPVVSLVIGVAFLHETMSFTKFCGVVIVLLGAVLILLRERIIHRRRDA